MFATGDDADSILDFQDGIDKIDLSGWSSVAGFADMQAKDFISSVDGNVVISDGLGEELTIVDFKIGKLDRTDFIF